MAYFNSLDPLCRTPLGAVSTEQSVTFTLTLSPKEGAMVPQLLLFRDSRSTHPDLTFPLVGVEASAMGRRWQYTFCSPQPSLWFYCFQVGGQRLLRRADGSAGREGDLWQLTVYDAQFTTPAWMRGAVAYQIFPDRFYKSGQPKGEMPTGRWFHGSWGEMPQWRPDGDSGEITNRDFFGGDLQGIREKLPYLQELGVTVLYLNPIFESHSNHRYDTADYKTIDPLLGTEEDFILLASDAAQRGIHILLDGVFNHTGSDSRYFNAHGRYPQPGAAQSQESPWYSWYQFTHWPDRYDSWWGFKTLPNLREEEPSLLKFLCGEDGVVRKWLRLGASGWRLDVADELPDVLLDQVRQAARAEKPDALVLGEVWEDASHKISYSHRRRYLLGDQLDSVMNYPLMDGVLEFIRHGDGAKLMRTLSALWENYPPQVLHCLLNSLSTHDTLRAITRLAGEPYQGQDREWQAAHQVLPREDYLRGVVLLKLAAVLQYTLFGVPCLYYGDEWGMAGYRDPFNRAPMVWEAGDGQLQEFFVELGQLRRELPALREGEWIPLAADESLFVFMRRSGEQSLLVAVNRSPQWRALSVPTQGQILLGDLEQGGLPGMGYLLLELE